MAKDKKVKGAEQGFASDGVSKNTFGPEPKSTPNEVGAVEGPLSRKSGKGKITGGIEDESIFGGIDYTGNTVDAGKQDFKSVDKGVFLPQSDYSQGDDCGHPANHDGGVFGEEFGKKDKIGKLNDGIMSDEAEKEPNEGKSGVKKRKLTVENEYKGKNPTSTNVGSRNIFTGGKVGKK